MMSAVASWSMSSHALHAVAIEQRLIHRILARDSTGVRDGELRRQLRAPDLQRNDRNPALPRLFEARARALADCAQSP